MKKTDKQIDFQNIFKSKYLKFFKDIFGTNKSILLVISCFITIFLDAFSIALIIPLMKIVQTSDFTLLDFNVSKYLLDNNLKSIEFLIFLFLIYIIFKNILLFFLHYYKSSLIFNVQAKLSKKILFNYINKEFKIFSKIQFSEINRNSISEVGHLVSLLSNGLDLFVEILIVILVFIIIAYANYYLMFFFFVYLLCGYLIYKFTSLFLYNLGKQRIEGEKNRITIIQNIYNTIKEIKTYKAENIFLSNYNVPNQKVAYTHAMENTINPINKYIFEILTVISVLVYIIFTNNTEEIIEDAILIFAAMFRIFPSFNKIISALQKINIHKKSFTNIAKLYYEKVESSYSLNLTSIKDIQTFEFHLKQIEIEENKFIKDLKIKFSKRDKLILVRANSGFGKSVLLNCMSGILKSNCQYIINGKKYSSNIAGELDFFSYNSQNAPLLNDTILNNITFNDNEKDSQSKNLEKAIYISGLHYVIEMNANKLQTIVSDRGHNVSGGQAQRITLARTIYKNKKIMILDESLSALDIESQIEILEKLKKQYEGIIILISHDPIKYGGFDKVIDLDK